MRFDARWRGLYRFVARTSEAQSGGAFDAEHRKSDKDGDASRQRVRMLDCGLRLCSTYRVQATLASHPEEETHLEVAQKSNQLYNQK
jgi:hypothetical protein